MIRDCIDFIKKHKKLYLASNVFYYGLIVVGMAVISFFPGIQATLLSVIGQSFESGPMKFIAEAYKTSFIKALAYTFLINTALASFIEITLPSFLFPPWGLLMSGLRAILWGLIFSPSEAFPLVRFLGSLPVIILEGQGYVLALFGTLALLYALIKPQAFGKEKRMDAYKLAIVMNLKLYVLIAIVLLLAAAVEAFIVIYLMG